MKAPLFCVPQRLYHLVSPVHDQRLCLFQKLQTQSPESAALARGREERDKRWTHKKGGGGGEGGERGETTGESEQQWR